MKPVTHNPAASRFEMQHGDLISVSDYELQGRVMTVTHVIVPGELRGQGIASKIATAIVEHARGESLKISPQCSFMAAWMERHAEHADLLA